MPAAESAATLSSAPGAVCSGGWWVTGSRRPAASRSVGKTADLWRVGAYTVAFFALAVALATALATATALAAVFAVCTPAWRPCWPQRSCRSSSGPSKTTWLQPPWRPGCLATAQHCRRPRRRHQCSGTWSCWRLAGKHGPLALWRPTGRPDGVPEVLRSSAFRGRARQYDGV